MSDGKDDAGHLPPARPRTPLQAAEDDQVMIILLIMMIIMMMIIMMLVMIMMMIMIMMMMIVRRRLGEEIAIPLILSDLASTDKIEKLIRKTGELIDLNIQ